MAGAGMNETTLPRLVEYEAFLRRKVCIDPSRGFEISPDEINPALKPHTRAIVQWAIGGGATCHLRRIRASQDVHATRDHAPHR